MTSLCELFQNVEAKAPPTVEGLKKVFLRRLAQTKDSENDVVWAIADELSNDMELLELWWDAIGFDLLRALLCDKRTGAQLKKKDGSAPSPRPAWRDGLTKRPEVVWDLELPVGATGTRKRLGDFNRDDVAQIETFYHGQANIMTSRAAYFHRIGRAMGPDDTLEKMATEGRLEDHQMGFIGTGMQDLATFKWMTEESDSSPKEG